jgi:hypothetical protein
MKTPTATIRHADGTTVTVTETGTTFPFVVRVNRKHVNAFVSFEAAIKYATTDALSAYDYQRRCGR